MTEGFDRWLDAELNRRLSPIAGAPAPPPRYDGAGGPVGRRALAGGLFTAAGTKALFATVLASAALGTAVVSSHQTAAVPDGFGQQVEQEVQACQALAAHDAVSVGRCVSSWVRAHNPGASHGSAAATAPGATDHGRGNGGVPGQGVGNPGAQSGQAASHPTHPAHPSQAGGAQSTPASTPTAHPTPQGGGPPSSHPTPQGGGQPTAHPTPQGQGSAGLGTSH